LTNTSYFTSCNPFEPCSQYGENSDDDNTRSRVERKEQVQKQGLGFAPRKISRFMLSRMPGNAPVRSDMNILAFVHPVASSLTSG